MRASNRHVLNAAARIDSQETRKVQLHCQPVSNAIPLGLALPMLVQSDNLSHYICFRIDLFLPIRFAANHVAGCVQSPL